MGFFERIPKRRYNLLPPEPVRKVSLPPPPEAAPMDIRLQELIEAFDLVECYLVEDAQPDPVLSKRVRPATGKLAELEDLWVKDKTKAKRIPDVNERMRIATRIDRYKRTGATDEELLSLERWIHK